MVTQMGERQRSSFQYLKELVFGPSDIDKYLDGVRAAPPLSVASNIPGFNVLGGDGSRAYATDKAGKLYSFNPLTQRPTFLEVPNAVYKDGGGNIIAHNGRNSEPFNYGDHGAIVTRQIEEQKAKSGTAAPLPAAPPTKATQQPPPAKAPAAPKAGTGMLGDTPEPERIFGKGNLASKAALEPEIKKILDRMAADPKLRNAGMQAITGNTSGFLNAFRESIVDAVNAEYGVENNSMRNKQVFAEALGRGIQTGKINSQDLQGMVSFTGAVDPAGIKKLSGIIADEIIKPSAAPAAKGPAKGMQP